MSEHDALVGKFATVGEFREMKITSGLDWVIVPTANFEQTVAFWRDAMGLPVLAQGVAVTDTQFARYAQIALPNGNTLEIVEPKPEVQKLYQAPIVAFTVEDIVQARRELEAKQIEFVSATVRTDDGWGWAFFRAPDGNVYQLQGSYQE